MDEIQDQCWYDSHFFLQESDLPEDIMMTWYLFDNLAHHGEEKEGSKG